MNSIKTLFILVFVSASFQIFSQIPVGTWRDHLPFSNGKKVTYGDNKVYCATPYAVFYYDLEDKSIHKLTKINQLSDIEVTALAYNTKLAKLIVGYKNGNIDIIDGSGKINIPDIKIKNVIADKNINSIYFSDNYAYLSTGFGIILLDLLRNEISDTYILGSEGSYMNINASIIFKGKVYALSEKGIFNADIHDPFLANYENWHMDTTIFYTEGKCYSPTIFDDNFLFLNYSNETNLSALMSFDGFRWGVKKQFNGELNSIYGHVENLFVLRSGNILGYDADYNSSVKYTVNQANDIISANNYLWVADNEQGLIAIDSEGKQTSISPNGPKSFETFEMYYNGGQVLVTPGGYNLQGEYLAKFPDVYSFNNERWESLSNSESPELTGVYDFVTLTGFQNPEHYFVGSYGYGIFEVKNNKVINLYNADNTDSVISKPIGGMTIDQDGNLWAVCRNSEYPFAVRTPDNKWYRYQYDSQWNKAQAYKAITAHNGDMWTISFKSNKDIYVWNCNGTPENGADDTYNSFYLLDDNKTLISHILYDIAVDVEGAIWIATASGVAVFDNPDNVTDRTVSHLARRPQLVIDGYLKNLLEDEIVTCIAVDGGNRKWFGTASGGVFLVSADGTEQILNLNTSNSKLFSNKISDIEINQKTGEVFIGTDKGIQSYMSTSTQSNDNYSSIYAFPNPVKQGYNGYITIRGLMYQTDVKITDLAGRLVFNTKSNGGDAIWNGKDLEGKEVASGIYLVLCTTPDGEESEATKILMIK